MEQEVYTKTRTSVDTLASTFSIEIESALNSDGTKVPSVFKSEVLSTPKIIDNAEGKEGELMMSYEGDSVGEINSDGELVIAPSNDDANQYSRGGTDNTDLIYTH